MMKPLTYGVHPTDFMIQLCAISVTLDYIRIQLCAISVTLDYIGLVVIISALEIISISVIGISAKSHISATLVIRHNREISTGRQNSGYF